MKKSFGMLIISLMMLLLFACENKKEIAHLISTNSEVVVEKGDGTVTESAEKVSNDISASAITFESIKTVADYDISEMAETFESVKLGKYEQDNNLENGPEDIEWIVLKKEGTKLLLLSKYVLDKYEYYDGTGFVEWSESSLRNWLNSYFYNTAFDDVEKSFIVRNTYSNYSIDVYSELGEKGHIYEGMTTSDLVTLMGFDELIEYFGRPSDSENDQFHIRKVVAKPTEFAKNITREYRIKLNVTNLSTWYKGCASYWLRTKFNYDSSPYTNIVEVVWYDGTFNSELDTDSSTGVRPMILIDTLAVNSDKAVSMLNHNVATNKSVNIPDSQIANENTGLNSWEMGYFDLAFVDLEKKVNYIRQRYFSDSYYKDSKPLYTEQPDGKIAFTYGLRDIDKDRVKELLFYNGGNLVMIFKLQKGRYENYPEYTKEYYPTMIEVENPVINRERDYRISLYPDNMIIKYYHDEIRDNWINYNEISEEERERIYNINNYDVYSYETVYLKDRELETIEYYDYYTNSENGLGSYDNLRENSNRDMSKAEAETLFNNHGTAIVLTDGSFVVE